MPSMTNVENACTAAGCPAACCQNISMELSKLEANRFLEGQTINYINPRDLDVTNLDEIPSIPLGFTIIEDPERPENTVYIYIKGYCPYLDTSTFNCLIYHLKKRPGICDEVEIRQYTCDIQRKNIGLFSLVKSLISD